MNLDNWPLWKIRAYLIKTYHFRKERQHMKNEKTSKRVSTIAAKILALDLRMACTVYCWDGLVYQPVGKLSDLKALAASALTQTADKKKRA